jgi:hypothetical protein
MEMNIYADFHMLWICKDTDVYKVACQGFYSKVGCLLGLCG